MLFLNDTILFDFWIIKMIIEMTVKIKILIQMVNPKKNVNTYLMAESNSNRVNGYDGNVGTIFDATDGVGDTAPYCSPQAVLRMDVKGCNLPEYLQKILSEREYSFATTVEKETHSRCICCLCLLKL